MATTSIPAVKQSLLAFLQADSGLAGVQVIYADPGLTNRSQECIFMGDVQLDEVAGALGQQRRDESYRLPVIVDVVLDGDDAQSCEERMWALVARVEQVLRTNANAGGAVNEWTVVEQMEPVTGIYNGQRAASCVVWIRCRHRK